MGSRPPAENVAPVYDRSANTSVWIDLASPSHPFFFDALLRHLDVDSRVTAREKTETVDLAETVGLNATVLGRDFDNPLLRKLGIPLRTASLLRRAPPANVSMSARNAMCILASRLRGVPSIHFTDNDITAYVDGLPFEQLYNRLEAMATHNVVPSAFDTDELVSRGADPSSIHTYDGYKEDIYVADFEPNQNFPDTLPVAEYAVIRPEALDAEYITSNKSLVPDLLASLVDAGLDVVYLPRGRGDEAWAERYPDDTVYVPDEALNGLQLAWHARCVLTGSGTMSREAACMQKPAVSFFPNALLSVDRQLVREGRVFHSRSPAAIREYVTTQSNTDIEPDRSDSIRVRNVVLDIVCSILSRYT